MRPVAPISTSSSAEIAPKAGGVVLLLATLAALAWANSPWAGSYHHLWDLRLSVGAGAWAAQFTLHQLVNDGLMVVLFFLVGLEIKRELLAGELRTARSAALPLVAALGGMVVPALCYAMVNRGTPSSSGWGIPMATDIAFALGVLALLGNRVPIGLKVFLSALAIVDDIGAVMVIAIFYSAGISWPALSAAGGLLFIAMMANRIGVRHPLAYGGIGLLVWAMVLLSGVHATVAGVLLAFTIPVRVRLREHEFLVKAEHTLDEFRAAAAITRANDAVTVLSNHLHHEAIEKLEIHAEQAQPPLIRLERGLHGVVAFVIMPLFALANAGVLLDAISIRAALSSSAAAGVMLGLVAGKPVGIVLFSWLAVRLGLAALPLRVNWQMIIGAGMLGGIGFTMSLFISTLAFRDQAMLDAAKVAILSASTIAGMAGGLVLLRTRLAAPVKEFGTERFLPQTDTGGE